MTETTPTPSDYYDQAGVVPFRRQSDGVQLCLITTTAGRWSFPKGFVDPGDTHEQAALKEAFEEAGLHGHVIGEPLGRFEVPKNGKPALVTLLLMEVTRCDKDWAESSFRKRRWVTEKTARNLLAREAFHFGLDAAIERLNEPEPS